MLCIEPTWLSWNLFPGSPFSERVKSDVPEVWKQWLLLSRVLVSGGSSDLFLLLSMSSSPWPLTWLSSDPQAPGWCQAVHPQVGALVQPPSEHSPTPIPFAAPFWGLEVPVSQIYWLVTSLILPFRPWLPSSSHSWVRSDSYDEFLIPRLRVNSPSLMEPRLIQISFTTDVWLLFCLYPTAYRSVGDQDTETPFLKLQSLLIISTQSILTK